MKKKKFINIEWDKAHCQGENIENFYPKPNAAPLIYPKLKVICRDCPIIQDCLSWSLHHEEYGFWAGIPERTRWQIRRDRNITLETLSIQIPRNKFHESLH
jgi:WhiB family redox-sensing transcriptional regulator